MLFNICTNDDGGLPLFLGLDLSTQSLKAIVINQRFELVCEKQVTYSEFDDLFNTSGGIIRHDDGLRVTSPPLLWIHSLEVLFDRLSELGLPFHRIVAVSGVGQQHSSVFWRNNASVRLASLNVNNGSLKDQLGGVNDNSVFSVNQSPLWMDSSTTAYCKLFTDKLGGSVAVASKTGSCAYERFTGHQIAKIYSDLPKAYADTERISLVSSFLATLLIGKYAPVDYSDGSGMNLLDITEKDWCDDCLNACAPDLRKRLGQPVSTSSIVGFMSKYMCSRWGFRSECIVSTFTGDNPGSFAGLHIQTGDIAISLGTSDTMFLSLSHPRPAKFGHIFCSPIDQNEYMALLCYKNGSLMREAICREEADNDWTTFDQLVQYTKHGLDGRLGLYFDLAEITPSGIVGRFEFAADGLTQVSLTSSERTRAVVEGQAIAKRVHAELLGYDLKAAKRIIITGGASKNPCILQVFSNVFQLPIHIMEVPNSAALGSAFLARIAWEQANNVASFDYTVSSFKPYLFLTPDASTASAYDRLCETYKAIEKRHYEQLAA